MLSFLITSFSFSQIGGKNFIDQPYIEVTGTIETEISPNEIYLNIVLNENNNKGKLSIEDQENQMISILKTLEIDLDKNFSILDFNGYYKRKFLADNDVTKIKNYELIVNNGETLGKVFQALDQINISNISIAKVSHSDIEKIRKKTKLKALKIAKEKATNYAEALNQTLGKAIFIQEIHNSQTSNLYNNSFGMLNEIVVTGYGASEKQEKIQDLNFKTITITATVMTKFILN
jgi:hypothetical protein